MNLYRSFRKIGKRVLNAGADTIAAIQGFTFPPTYPWYWKYEYLLGYYEPETTRFFKQHVKEGMVAVDIGANLGYFTRLLSKRVGDTGIVYAFEPDEENWKYLVENTRRLSNVKIYKMAVSDSTGTGAFYHVHQATGTHSILPSDNAERRTVEMTTLDDFLKTRGAARVDVIKIDVEGAEERVFAGMSATLAAKPHVVFEYTPEIAEQFVQRLQQRFTIRALSSDGSLVPFSEVRYRQGKRLYTNLVLSA